MTVVGESRYSPLKNGENAKMANIGDIRLLEDNLPGLFSRLPGLVH